MQRRPFVPALLSALTVTALAAFSSATPAVAQTESPPFSPSTAIFANHILNHAASVAWLAISPDGGSVASAGADGNVKQWSAKSGKLLQTSSVPDSAMWTVDYSPDGKLLAGVGQDVAVHVWDAATGKQVRTLQGHEAQVQGLNFSPDGKRLLSSSADQTARVWDVATGKELVKIGNLGDVTWAYFSTDGKMLITLALTGTVGLWDAASGKAIRTIATLKEPGFTATILPMADGKTLVSSDMNVLRFWDMTTGKEVRSVPTTHTDFIYSIAFSPDGKYMATGSGDKTAKIYEAASGKELFTITGHTDPVWFVKFTPDSKTLATGSFDGTVRLWNIPLWERFMGF